MGLFSFLKKSPEKSEAAGDACMGANNVGQAKLEYESALHMIEKKHPEDAEASERVKEKLINSKEALARQHLESGDKLVAGNMPAEAERLLTLALSLTEDPELAQTLKERLARLDADIPEEEPDVDEGLDSGGDEDAYDADHRFDVLCMTLPEEIGEAYQSYGQSFKEGYLDLSEGKFAEAAEKLQKALDAHPSSHISVELATALINLGKADEAISHLTGYLETYPTSFHGVSLLCEIYCDLNHFDKAHDVITRLPEAMRNSLDAVRLNGRIYFQEKDYPHAEEIFRKALSDSEHDTDVSRELAMTLSAAGKKEEARDLYADLLNQCSRCRRRINPLDKKAFADLSLELGDVSDKTLELYLSLGNDYTELRADCYEKAGFIFSQNGNEKEARRFKKLAEAAG